MKRVYWRPHKTSKAAIVAVGMTAVVAVLFVEHPPVAARDDSSHRRRMVAASQLADTAFKTIRQERLNRGHEFPRRLDPGKTGMVGLAMSPLTTLPANLKTKQTSVNPNFAAVVVDLLAPLDLKPGDCVAVGCTGSFPALNVCLCAALETIGCRPVVIHSVSSSQFGANHPQMTWLDMETILYQHDLISFRSAAATPGGYGDRAVGAADESKRMIEETIARNGVRPLEFENLADSIAQRMQLYDQRSYGRLIKAYVNVGGGAASIHGAQGKARFEAGVTEAEDEQAEAVDCVMTSFAQRGVPVVHLGDVIHLAKQYRLPIAPQALPEIDRSVGPPPQPNRYLAGGVLLCVLLGLRACVRTGAYERARQGVLSWLAKARAGSDVSSPVIATPGCELMV